MFRGNWGCLLVVLGLATRFTAHAQIDPIQRRLIEVGYNQPIEGHGPIAAYGFFYYNQPGFY